MDCTRTQPLSPGTHEAPSSFAGPKPPSCPLLGIVIKPTIPERVEAQAVIHPALRVQAHAAIDGCLRGAKWSSQTFTPTLVDISLLKPFIPLNHHWAYLEPPAPLTPFEQAAGRPMVYRIPGDDTLGPAQASFSALRDLFCTLIPNATQQLPTREGYWSAWRGFITFLFVHNMLHQECL